MARKPFVVIDSEILSSSVWSEAAHVKLVWLTLLILCDTEGYVGAALPGIARAAGVTLEQAQEAMLKFQGPDEHSRTKTDQGRRVREVERGWLVLNFKEHLDRLSRERAKSRERMRRHREKKRAERHGYVTVTAGNREQGIGNREQTEERKDQPSRPGLPANPLIAGRRPAMEMEAYRLIREINALEPDRDPTEILLEAAKWQSKDGNFRSKVRLETMTDDHLIRTVHDLKSILAEVQGGTKAAR